MKNKVQILCLVLLGLFMISFLAGIVSAGISAETIAYFNNLFGVETWQQVVIGIMIILIIVVGLYDMLELLSLFENWWVKAIIAGGLGVIAAVTNIVRLILQGLLSFAAFFGALAIAIEIGVVVFVFIGLSFGSTWAARFAARRRAGRSVAKGELFAGKLKGLKKVAEAAAS